MCVDSLPMVYMDVFAAAEEVMYVYRAKIGIGLCYSGRTQRPLTPRETCAAKPRAKLGVLHKRLADLP